MEAYYYCIRKNDTKFGWHKATVQELIEHFK